MVCQDFHEYISSNLHSSYTRSHHWTPKYWQAFAIQDISTILDIWFISIFSDLPSARRRNILWGITQCLVWLPRLRFYPSRLWTNRAAVLSSVQNLQGSPEAVPNRYGQRHDNQRVRETSVIRTRDRAQDTIVVCVDCDDFIHFQHGDSVHQYFPNVQGRVNWNPYNDLYD